MKQTKNYDFGIDLLRVVAIFAVLLIHTSARSLEYTYLDVARIPFSLLLNQLTRFAVPLFFMISGFSLELSQTNFDPISFYKKRLNKILIPFVFWSVIYYLFVYEIPRAYPAGLLTGITQPDFYINFGWSLIYGSASYQLYFIPSLLILYFVFPFLHLLIKKFGHWIWTIGLLAIQLFVLYQDYFIKPYTFFYPVNIAILNFFFFYFGMSLSLHSDSLYRFIRKYSLGFAAISVFSGLFVYREGMTRYLETKNYLTFYSQWRPSILIYTLATGASLYYFKNVQGKIIEIIKSLSKLSFFIFLVHVIVLENVWHWILLPLVLNSNPKAIEALWFDPLFFVLVAGISTLTAYLVHKIPNLNKITG